jgi:eukaryotic-like serine/threonine-protein kinase
MSTAGTPDWTAVQRMLDDLLELPPEARATRLADPHAGDPEVRTEAGRLLELEGAAEGFFSRPLAALGARLLSPDSERPPERIGPYRVLREVGRGGMGAVYLAERDDGQFRMRVALKVIRSWGDPGEIRRRFLAERQILASLDHPRIARLLDGGIDTEGDPFLAMEYVEGEPIDRYCASRRMSVPSRLRLFLQVCEAVDHAHRHLIVHRDLKPSNILVTSDGAVKLLDFGIAKLLQPTLDPGERGDTATRLRALTPEYASPEQVRGERVTTASDVYALGVLLYELLTGVRPYAPSVRTPHELERAVCEAHPTRPSTAAGRRELRGDLDDIVLKALRKEPERRYPSAALLRDDLERHLGGLPVRAREGSRTYRARKFVGRHRAGVAAVALVALSLVTGAGMAAHQARVASAEARRAEAVTEYLVSVFSVADPNLSNAAEVTARDLLEQGARRVEAELGSDPGLQAEMMLILGGIHRRLGLLDPAERLLQGALERRRARHGSGHPGIPEALDELALLAMDRGLPEDAELLHNEALELRRTRFRAGHPEVATGMRHLAAVLTAQARYDEAEPLLREALAIDRRALGDDDPQVARDLGALATLLRGRGELDGAMEAAAEALRIHLLRHGPEHLETATAMNNLALLHRDLGRIDTAAELYREVLDFDIRRLGEEHRYTLTVMNNLAGVLREQGDVAGAEAHFRRILEIGTRVFPDPHPFIATVLNNLAGLLREIGALEESEVLFRRALESFRTVYGDEHPSVGTAHAVLAGTLHRRGEHREAELLYREALLRLEESVGPQHPRTAAALLGFGRLLTDVGRAGEAEPLLRRAVDVRRQRLAEDHWQIADAEGALGSALLDLHRPVEAGPLLRRAADRLEGVRGIDQQRNLGRIVDDLGRLPSATSHRLASPR